MAITPMPLVQGLLGQGQSLGVQQVQVQAREAETGRC